MTLRDKLEFKAKPHKATIARDPDLTAYCYECSEDLNLHPRAIWPDFACRWCHKPLCGNPNCRKKHMETAHGPRR